MRFDTLIVDGHCILLCMLLLLNFVFDFVDLFWLICWTVFACWFVWILVLLLYLDFVDGCDFLCIDLVILVWLVDLLFGLFLVVFVLIGYLLIGFWLVSGLFCYFVVLVLLLDVFGCLLVYVVASLVWVFSCLCVGVICEDLIWVFVNCGGLFVMLLIAWLFVWYLFDFFCFSGCLDCFIWRLCVLLFVFDVEFCYDLVYWLLLFVLFICVWVCVLLFAVLDLCFGFVWLLLTCWLFVLLMDLIL